MRNSIRVHQLKVILVLIRKCRVWRHSRSHPRINSIIGFLNVLIILPITPRKVLVREVRRGLLVELLHQRRSEGYPAILAALHEDHEFGDQLPDLRWEGLGHVTAVYTLKVLQVNVDVRLVQHEVYRIWQSQHESSMKCRPSIRGRCPIVDIGAARDQSCSHHKMIRDVLSCHILGEESQALRIFKV